MLLKKVKAHVFLREVNGSTQKWRPSSWFCIGHNTGWMQRSHRVLAKTRRFKNIIVCMCERESTHAVPHMWRSEGNCGC